MKPDRILVRAPTWIGDAVMATPVLRALRGAYPQAEIVVEGRPLLAELLAGLDSFDRFLPDPGGGAIAMVSRAARLRRKGFDWAVLLPDSQRAALGPFLAGIPKRIGYARDRLRRWHRDRARRPLRNGSPDSRRSASSASTIRRPASPKSRRWSGGQSCSSPTTRGPGRSPSPSAHRSWC